VTAWLEGTVAGQTRWTSRLLSLRIAMPAGAPLVRFEAGQFGKLALDIEGERVARPYSFVNPPGDAPLEFFYAIVDQGPLSPRLAMLDTGDKVFLASSAAGFLVLSEVPDAENLWLVATGTGVGPFLSILRTATPWKRFRHVTLVYAARHASELAYAEAIDALAQSHAGQLSVVRITSRDAGGALLGRIPALIADGSLESAARCEISASRSQVMLCGNPDMVKDAIAMLALRGMKKHRRRSPGQITVENYW
jgi:ferredoxin--NADP+ reductase